MSLQARLFILRGGHLHTHTQVWLPSGVVPSCPPGPCQLCRLAVVKLVVALAADVILHGPQRGAMVSSTLLTVISLSACSGLSCRELPGQPAAPWGMVPTDGFCMSYGLCGEKLHFILLYPASQGLRWPTVLISLASLPFLSSAPL